MILAIAGEDLFSKNEEIQRFLQETLGDNINDPMASRIIYASDPQIPSIADSVIEACDNVSMFSPEQTVVLRQADVLRTSDEKLLADWLSSNPSCTLLLEFTKAPTKSSSLGSALKTIKVPIKEFPNPKPWEMEKWVRNLCATHFKKKIDNTAVQYITEALGNDTANIVSNLEKILLLAPETPCFTEELVRQNIVAQRSLEAYEINNFFGDRDPVGYVKKLHELIEAPKIGSTPIISSLFEYATRLLHINTMLNRGLSEKEIAETLGLNHYAIFVKGNIVRRARNWKIPLLLRLLKRLAELDCEIKSGKYPSKISQELALAALVIPPR